MSILDTQSEPTAQTVPLICTGNKPYNKIASHGTNPTAFTFYELNNLINILIYLATIYSRNKYCQIPLKQKEIRHILTPLRFIESTIDFAIVCLLFPFC